MLSARGRGRLTFLLSGTRHSTLVTRLQRYPQIACSVQHRALVNRVQLREGDVERDVAFAGHRGHHPPEERTLQRIGPRADGTVGQGARWIGDQRAEVRPLLHADPLARLAPTEWTVEREVVGRQFFKASATLLTRTMQAERQRLPLLLVAFLVNDRDTDQPLAEIKCQLDGFGETGTERRRLRGEG